MGCDNSTAKDAENAQDMPEEAKNFIEYVQQTRHPVAERILQEWNNFAKAQEEVEVSKSNNAVHYNVGSETEVWATTERTAVTHKSVDEVGSSFLHYLRYDLSRRHWGGNFNYSVAGVATQGFILVTAEVDTVPQPPREISSFKLQLHYHTPAT